MHSEKRIELLNARVTAITRNAPVALLCLTCLRKVPVHQILELEDSGTLCAKQYLTQEDHLMLSQSLFGLQPDWCAILIRV